MKGCPSPAKCPHSGSIFFCMSEGEFAGQSFTVDCTAYAEYKATRAREKKVEKILGPLSECAFGNFDGTENPRALRVARRFVDHEAWKIGGWLVLSGAYGTGKTHLAAAIAREAITAGVSVTFASLAGIMTHDFDMVKKRLKELKEYALVVIDDFGVETSQNWVMPHIFDLFNFFDTQKRGVVITTNLSVKGFQAAVGDRISDRVAQHGVVVETKGASYRRKKRIVWME